MKIVIVGTAHPYRGGLAAYNERLAHEFVKEGHEVEVFTFSLQYPSFLFPGKSQFSDEKAPSGLFNALRTVYNSKLNQDQMASEFHHYEDVADSFKESTLGMIGNNNIKNSIAAQQVEASIGTSLENYEDAPATDDVPPADFNTQAFDDFDFNDLKSFAQDKDNISPLDEITPDEQYNGSAKIDDHLC